MSSANHPVQASALEGDNEFERLLGHLWRTRGVDFTAYKRPSLLRRLRRRMTMVSIPDFGRYTEYLEANPDEFHHLFNTILINVTAFFRDSAPWDVLRTTLIPELIEARGEDNPIRIWSAGCASGEETYTVAMLFAEALGPEAFARRVRIYATDVDDQALGDARAAVYSRARVAHVPEDLVRRYFDEQGDRFALRPELRRAVIFGRHDLIRDPPISRISLLVCRNTLMYFNTDIQTQILSRFHFALTDDGLLLLGKAETLLTRSELFAPLDLRRRLFRKINHPDPRARFAALVPPRREGIKAVMSKQPDLYPVAFEAAPIAHIVVDTGGTLAMYNDRARSLFGLAPADVGRPFHELELSYRPVELRSPIRDAQEHRRPVVLKDVRLEGRDAEPRNLEVHVTPLFDPQGLGLGASVTFADESRVQELQQQLTRSTQDLESTYEELQSTNEELETTNEELQSTVEELETTNEELQSTNEELETMNEELQSTNEELQSINRELRERSEALNDVNDFLESIMRGLRGAVVVVNQELHVIAWNHRSEEMWGLRAAEVRNKNVFGLDIGLPIETFRREIRACLSGETELANVTVDAINRRGKPVRCTVTCTPLFGKGHIQGVIVMVDEPPAD
jgi:two-component system, chemotaxis family, CheB/CheR fusion protein